MDVNYCIKLELYSIVYGKKGRKRVTAQELSEIINKGKSYLSRMASPDDPTPFQLDYLIKIMKYRKCFDPLRSIALDCGFTLVKLPNRVKKTKFDDNKLVSEFQKSANKANSALIKILEDKDAREFNEFSEAIHSLIEQSLIVKKTVEKRISEQLELELI